MINRSLLTDHIAQVCRHTYIHLRRFYYGDAGYEPGPRWDGGVWKGKRYTSIWRKVAEFVQHEKLHPIEWVKLHFDKVYQHDRPPYPTDLLDRSLISEYKAVPRPDRAQIDAMWKAELSKAFHLIKLIEDDYNADYGNACKILLALKRDEFSPLFGYILATVVGDDKAKDELFMPALMQLSEACQDYLESPYGKHLSTELIEYAKSLAV